MEKFAKFPISTSFENGEPRLLLVAVDIHEATPVIFDSYDKEDGTRKTDMVGMVSRNRLFQIIAEFSTKGPD